MEHQDENSSHAAPLSFFGQLPREKPLPVPREKLPVPRKKPLPAPRKKSPPFTPPSFAPPPSPKRSSLSFLNPVGGDARGYPLGTQRNGRQDELNGTGELPSLFGTQRNGIQNQLNATLMSRTGGSLGSGTEKKPEVKKKFVSNSSKIRSASYDMEFSERKKQHVVDANLLRAYKKAQEYPTSKETEVSSHPAAYANPIGRNHKYDLEPYSRVGAEQRFTRQRVPNPPSDGIRPVNRERKWQIETPQEKRIKVLTDTAIQDILKMEGKHKVMSKQYMKNMLEDLEYANENPPEPTDKEGGRTLAEERRHSNVTTAIEMLKSWIRIKEFRELNGKTQTQTQTFHYTIHDQSNHDRVHSGYITICPTDTVGNAVANIANETGLPVGQLFMGDGDQPVYRDENGGNFSAIVTDVSTEESKLACVLRTILADLEPDPRIGNGRESSLHGCSFSVDILYSKQGSKYYSESSGENEEDAHVILNIQPPPNANYDTKYLRLCQQNLDGIMKSSGSGYFVVIPCCKKLLGEGNEFEQFKDKLLHCDKFDHVKLASTLRILYDSCYAKHI